MSSYRFCDCTVRISRLAFIVVISQLLFACSSPSKKAPLLVQPAKPAKKVTLNIKAVGDMMLGTNFPLNHLADDDGKSLLAQVSPILQNADITFGNLEGSLLAKGEPRKECKDPRRCYLFRSPPHYAQYLKQAGFDVLSLANNHAQDFGDEGARESMRHLDGVGIRHTGQEGDIASWVVKGLKVAVIAYAPFIGSHDFLNTKMAQQQVKQLAAEHDVVMVSMHAGGEGLDALHVPFAEEFFYGENRGDVAAFSRAVIDAGADLVIGHGPHVPRGVELYRDRLIAYSLGNFCTYYGISVAKTKGLAPILDVTIDEQGRFLKGEIVSTRQIRPGGPVPDKANTAAKLMKRLSEADFPGSPLFVSDEGKLFRKQSVPH
jgi:poly-gamma-glutamate capsule biosynthesis protein CapA/YwtB (metallophosphatase superfamily)